MSRKTRFSRAQLRALAKLTALAASLRSDTFRPGVEFAQFYSAGPMVNLSVYMGGVISADAYHCLHHLRTLSDFNRARAWLKRLHDDHA